MKITLKVQSIIEHKPGQLRVTFVPPAVTDKTALPSVGQNSQLHVLVAAGAAYQVGNEYAVTIAE